MTTFRTLLLTEDGSYADGSWTGMAPIPESYGLDGWGAVLDRAAARVADDGVIVMTGAMAVRLGLGVDPSGMTEPERGDHPALQDARGHGWKVSYLSAWTTFQRPAERREDRYAVHVGVLDWMKGDDLPSTCSTPQESAALLHAWTDEFGVPWAGTAAVAGVTLVRQFGRGPHDKRNDRFARPRWELPADIARPEWSHVTSFRGLSWRPPVDGRPTWTHEHTYDVNKQWITAAGQTLLACDSLKRTGPRAYDPKLSGFWLVEFEAWTRGHLLPDPAGGAAAAGRSGAVWVSTPRLGLVDQLCQRHDEWQHPGYKVLDSYTAPGSLVLKPWAAALRKVMDDPDLGPATKSVYAKTFTTISRPGRRVYRPDWAAAVVDMAQANLIRKLLEIQLQGGPAPLRIGADQPTWASSAPNWQDDVPAGLEQYLSEQPGKLKFKVTKALEGAV